MLLKRFLHSTSGNFALMLAVGLPAVLTAVAFAVDVSTLTRAKTDLQNALDAANLAASHLGDAEEARKVAFDRYFQVNVAGHPELSNASASLTVDKGVNYVRTNATASADVNLNFAFLFGNSTHIAVDAGATEATNDLEVVLVLDNTGSMASGGSGAKITALKTATKSLIADLEEAQKSPMRKVRAALVPFVTAVNVNGDGFDPAWIDMDGQSSLNGVHFPKLDGKRPNHMALFRQLRKNNTLKETGWNGTGWKGCVEARPGAYNVSDAPPDPKDPDSLFVPYFAPDDIIGIANTTGRAMKPSNSYGNDSNYYNNSYLNDDYDKTVIRDRPEINVLGIDLQGLLSRLLSLLLGGPDPNDFAMVAKYVAPTPNPTITETGIATVQPGDAALTVGPNRACPTPIVPLTEDLAKLDTAADAMKAWNGSGTNVSEGLSWGMRVLSPEAPYTNAVPWRTPNTSKIVVLLTDGENVVFGASKESKRSDYTSYGYLADGRFGTVTSQTDAARKVDEWTLDVCQKLKEQNVQLYTITLQSDTAANRALYGKCASNPTDYYAVNDPSKLPNVFQQIATKFTKLQLTN